MVVPLARSLPVGWMALHPSTHARHGRWMKKASSTLRQGTRETGQETLWGSLALMANAWIGQAIQQVHGEVDEDHQAGDQQDAVLHYRVVAGADGLNQPFANARPGKDGLGEDRTGQQGAGLQAEH